MSGHAAGGGGGRAAQPETAEMTSLPSSRTTAHYPPTLTHRLPPPRREAAEMKAQRRASLPVSSPSPLVPVARPRSTTATMTAMRVATSSPSSTAVAPLPRSPQATQPSVVPLPPMGKPVRQPCNPPAQPSFPESPKQTAAPKEKVADFLTAVTPRSKSPRTSPAYIVETTAVAPSSVMNGYEVPDLVQSAGGLQSLIFMFDHRDGENSSAAAAAPLLDLADFSFSTPAPPTGSGGDGDSNVNGGGDGARKQQRGSAEQTGEKAVPMVQARVPANIAPRFQVSSYGDVADDWYNLASTDAGDGESTVKAARDGDKDTTSATESANQSDSLTDTRTSLSGGDTPSDSILLPTALRHSRSSEGSTGESIPFHKRVVMRQETDADVQCYHAYEYVLSFFEQRGHDVDEDRSGGGSSRSSQVSRPSSRNRVAVVHGTDFQPKRSLRRIPTEEERRAAFVSRTLRDLYTNVARAYQVAGIPKGYLDALYMVEVLKGAREPRPRSRSNTAANLVSPPSSDEDEAEAQLRSTEVVPADDDLDRALRGAFRPARGRGGRGGGRGRCAGVEGGSAGRRECSSEPAAQSCKRSKGKGNARGGAKEEASEAAASGRRATASPGPQQGNAHAFMLRVLRKNSVHFDYQHNPMPLHTYRALQRSGDVLLNGKTFRLPIWDDEKSGYLVTGVFDRTLSFPKNYRDVLTREIYAEEQKGGVSTSFPLPEMTRQHNAVNARCVSDDSGVTLRGCSIVRHPDVFGIYDGRVQGCQVPRACRDHRRTGMHAAIQSLAHYMNLFSKYPSLVRLLHPQDRYRYPVVNPVGGMYCVPLIINGAARLVKVDDYVPIDPVTGTFRCLTSSANELFPTLLEKALLKANSGGVTLPLMEASHVLHQLCGWIPQTIPFATDPAGNEVMWDGMLYPGEMWDALSAMYQRGRLAMSLVGIWEKEETRATAPSFVRRNLFSRPAHFTVPVSFPVVDLISCVESTAGRATRRIRAVMLRDTTKDPTSADSGPPVPTALSEATLTSLGYSTVHRDAGVFCVTWEEATTCFDHCSVSLCPSTYWSKDALKLRPREPTRICCHDVYDMRNEGKVMFHQPQYHLCFSNVESSSRVFVVYTQHTSMQHPLPWPCEGLTNATVDRCSGGGAAVQLRLYEVTSLPSILQWRREECGGAGGRNCAFASCVGRRLTGELEGPRPSCVVASALGRANSMVTVAFDVSPGTREYVLVLDVEADATTDAADRMSSFPYTLTMYTSMNVMEQTNPGCVPFVAPRGPSASCGEKSGGKGRRSRVRRLGDGGDGQQQQQTLAETATMHAIPAALPVNARTVRGVWGTNRTPKRVAIVKHDLVTEELWTGPQFHLRLSQPDDVFIRLYATSPCSSTSLPSAAVKLLLVRKTTPKSLAVMGYVMGQSDVVLESSGWSTEGAVLDSFSPHTVLLDRKRELTQSPTWTRREYNAVIKLDLYLDPRADVEEASCLLVPHPDPADCVQSLIVHAFAQGMLISPEACEVTCMGSVVPPSVELRRLLSDRTACYTFNAVNGESAAVVEEEGSQSYACREPCLDIFVDVEVLNTSPFMAVHFPENEQSGRLVSRLRTVAKRTLNSGNQQSTKALRALSYISTLIQNSGLAEEKKSFLLGLARGLSDWCTARASSRADVARTSPLMLRQLPAGDYTIVTCFKPTAGTYVRNRDNPRGAPTLVQGGDVEFNVEVQLLRQRVELTAIATTVDPVTREAESHSAQLNEYPANA